MVAGVGTPVQSMDSDEPDGARRSRLDMRTRLESVPAAKNKVVGTACPKWPFVYRGIWIRTSDLLNPISGALAKLECIDAGKALTVQWAFDVSIARRNLE